MAGHWLFPRHLPPHLRLSTYLPAVPYLTSPTYPSLSATCLAGFNLLPQFPLYVLGSAFACFLDSLMGRNRRGRGPLVPSHSFCLPPSLSGGTRDVEGCWPGRAAVAATLRTVSRRATWRKRYCAGADAQTGMVSAAAANRGSTWHHAPRACACPCRASPCLLHRRLFIPLCHFGDVRRWTMRN